jgi:hypothetical protein
MDPARMFKESLTSRPELENSQDPQQTLAGRNLAAQQSRSKLGTDCGVTPRGAIEGFQPTGRAHEARP